MKFISAILFSAGVVSIACAAEESTPLADDTAKINYSVGYQIGSDFRYQEMEVRPEVVIQGILDAIGDDEALMSSSEMRRTMADLGKRIADQKRERKEALLRQRQEQSRLFHEENGKKPDVTSMESGLQYRVLEQGSGETPGKTDKVVVNYTGKLLDGTVFDSSFERGQPATFQVDQVIKGWTEALQLMKQGGRWELYIPPGLAYGDMGSPPNIPPHSTLIFEVELIAIQKNKPTE